ncbi:MAG: hypothetical protein ACK4GL_04655 [Flavobacteriales bacterium]
MKILFFDTWGTCPQMETSLEIAEKHQAAGDQVQIVNIALHLPFLEWLPDSGPETRAKMKIRFKKYGDWVRQTGIAFHTDLKCNRAALQTKVPKFENIEALKKHKVDDIDIGMAVASSLISHTCDDQCNLNTHRTLLENIYKSALLVMDSFTAWHAHVKPDLVYIRNARTATNRPILRICRKHNYRILIHERAGVLSRYTINPNYFHDRQLQLQLMCEHWKKSTLSEAEKEQIGASFFDQRMKGKNDGYVFIGGQKKELLPEDWDPTKRNITFFTGSITEFAAIDEENLPDLIFNSQMDAIAHIADFLSKKPDFRFYVRLHPNTSLSYKQEYERWLHFAEENKHSIRFIDGKSPVDTYALVRNSEKVIAHMSTVGIEAVYLGKPSIIVGNSYYYRLGANYVPQNEDELYELILNPDLPPKDKKGALIYGYYWQTYGESYRFYKPENIYIGTYKGIDFHHIEFGDTLNPMINSEIIKKMMKKEGVLNASKHISKTLVKKLIKK